MFESCCCVTSPVRNTGLWLDKREVTWPEYWALIGPGPGWPVASCCVSLTLDTGARLIQNIYFQSFKMIFKKVFEKQFWSESHHNSLTFKDENTWVCLKSNFCCWHIFIKVLLPAVSIAGCLGQLGSAWPHSPLIGQFSESWPLIGQDGKFTIILRTVDIRPVTSDQLMWPLVTAPSSLGKIENI